jgi:hypothetical protein
MQKKQATAKSKLVDWDLSTDLQYADTVFSDDFKGSIERYLMYGYQPGGFATAMLARDYERALYTADVHNRKVFWGIARWISERMPAGSWGSYETVDAWCWDTDGRRTKFKEKREKEQVWLTLVN